MKRVLLHICCGPCAVYSIKRLKNDDCDVRGFFYNPNIWPYEEYVKRREAVMTVCETASIKVIEGSYDIKIWDEICRNYKEEKEGGKRCSLCYKLRLAQTLRICDENKFDYFTTTLTISPRKDSKVIFDVCEKLETDKFLPLDFKKKDGFKKTMELAKKYNLYRQNYCGCRYSLPPHQLD